MNNKHGSKGSKRLATEQQNKDDDSEDVIRHTFHHFTSDEKVNFRLKLLKWYSKKKRDLPWRNFPKECNPNIKGYAVLVSEVMLQQTQVVTVKPYYERWMSRWPTVQHLAAGTLEQVNEMWAGLGYYARARRLHELANKVVKELDGNLPDTASKLEELLPGIGRYTAGAVASIAFGRTAAAVDGNVIRVLARLRLIGAYTSLQEVRNQMWTLAEGLADPKEPGDFTQALMELGAMVCTPQAPQCTACPVSDLCLARRRVQGVVPDIETLPHCYLCFSPQETWDPTLGVMNYPRKKKNGPPRHQESIVCILRSRHINDCEHSYFIVKRPSRGLLGNLWEFPTVLLGEEGESESEVCKKLLVNHGVFDRHIDETEFVGRVAHKFSHVRQMYVVYSMSVTLDRDTTLISSHYEKQRWATEEQFLSAAVSTGMKKIFQLFLTGDSKKVSPGKRRKSNLDAAAKKACVITDFFSKSAKM